MDEETNKKTKTKTNTLVAILRVIYQVLVTSWQIDMTLNVSDWQPKSDMDSIHSSCDVFDRTRLLKMMMTWGFELCWLHCLMWPADEVLGAFTERCLYFGEYNFFSWKSCWKKHPIKLINTWYTSKAKKILNRFFNFSSVRTVSDRWSMCDEPEIHFPPQC